MWPGKLNINMPKMVLKTDNISHLMVIDSIKEIKRNPVQRDTFFNVIKTY